MEFTSDDRFCENRIMKIDDALVWKLPPEHPGTTTGIFMFANSNLPENSKDENTALLYLSSCWSDHSNYLGMRDNNLWQRNNHYLLRFIEHPPYVQPGDQLSMLALLDSSGNSFPDKGWGISPER